MASSKRFQKSLVAIAAILAASTLVCSAAVASRTKEAYLEETDELAVREQKPSQEDLDMFFKDQAHLQDQTQTQTTESGIFGLPFLPSKIPFMSQLYELLSKSQFLMLPSIDPYSVGQIVMSAPYEFFYQFMNLMQMREHILSSLVNQTMLVSEQHNHNITNMTAQKQ